MPFMNNDIKSGKFSSSKPNLQQISKEDESPVERIRVMCNICKGKGALKCPLYIAHPFSIENCDDETCKDYTYGNCSKRCPECKGTRCISIIGPPLVTGGPIPSNQVAGDLRIITSANINKTKFLRPDVIKTLQDAKESLQNRQDIMKKEECPDCEGTGNTCENCGGDCYNGPNRICNFANEDHYHECETCKGEGEIDKPIDTRRIWIEESSLITKEALDQFVRNMKSAKTRKHKIMRNLIIEEY